MHFCNQLVLQVFDAFGLGLAGPVACWPILDFIEIDLRAVLENLGLPLDLLLERIDVQFLGPPSEIEPFENIVFIE